MSFSTAKLPHCRIAAFLLSAATLTLACGSTDTRFISIATGNTGGVYYPYGGAVARLISAHAPGVQATAEVTGASVDNLKLMQLGKVDIAFTLADTLAEAVGGRGPFATTGSIGSIRTLAVLYTNYTHVVARPDLGIRTVADLRGRVVSVGSPGSGTELIADRVLRSAGIDPRSGITRQALSVGESAGAFKDGKLDAFFWSGGVPTPAVQDLAATPGVRWALLRNDDLIAIMTRDYGTGLYSPVAIPSSAYQGMKDDVGAIGVKNLLVASSSLDDDLVERILAVLFERKDELVAAHPEARHLERPSTFEGVPAPYHSGAIKFYKRQ